MVTGYDDAYRRMGRLCEDSIRRYAERYQFPACIWRDFTSGRPAAWEKIRIIQNLFAAGWQYVCWIDADAAFVRFDEDIRDEIRPDKDLLWVAAEVTESRSGGRSLKVVQPCSGFMVVRNSEWSTRFLADAWARTEFLNHCWWELAAFIHLCGYHRAYDNKMADQGKRELLALVDPERESRPDAEILEHLGRLHSKWNWTDQSSKGVSDIVRHYTGSNGSRARRLELMEGDLLVR